MSAISKTSLQRDLPVEIIEWYSQPKAGKTADNEDLIVIGRDFNHIAVVDGSSLAAGEKLRGMTGGRFAAASIAHTIRNLQADIAAPEAFALITRNLRADLTEACREAGRDPAASLAAAATVIYSRDRNEIWSVADCPFMVGGKAYSTRLRVAEIRATARKYLIEEMLATGQATEQGLLENDPTPALVAKNLMPNSKIFANHPTSELGYGVINGQDIPARHIRVVSVGSAREIVLASDGYPRIFNTLTGTEAYLANVVARDPLCYKENPQPKAVKSGRYYDDVSFVRFRRQPAALSTLMP
jgi:glycerophosphoryl diester phosphodiesterase